MSVKTFDFLKIQNSKLLVCEIRPVKCFINTNAGRLKTTKWMNYQHWKELRCLLKTIAEDYERTRNNLKIAEDIKHWKPHTKISDSIKIAYVWALNKECCRHFLTPRKDTSWSDSEDDPTSLNDKGGRYKSLQACGDMLVVSVALLDETEIQRKRKSSKNVYDKQSHRATLECISSSQHLDRSLIMALDPTLVPETASISEYFATQTSNTKSSSNSDLDESRKIKPRILVSSATKSGVLHWVKGWIEAIRRAAAVQTFPGGSRERHPRNSKGRTSESTKKSPMQQHNLFTEDIQTIRKKRQRSFFDTDSSESTDLQLKSSSISSDSQAEAAASKILMKTSAVDNENYNLFTNKYYKKETITELNDITLNKKISNRVDSPLQSSTNDYAHKKTRCSFSVPLVEMDQQNQKGFIIKVENSDSPDETKENTINKDFEFSFSSRITSSISSPVDDNSIETPEPHLKVGKSPTSTKITIDNDSHPELSTSNKLEVYSLDSDTSKIRKHGHKKNGGKQTESISGIENSNVVSPDSHATNKIRRDYRNKSCVSNNNYLITQSEIVQNYRSDLIGKFNNNQEFCTETDKNKEQEIQKCEYLKSFREISKNSETIERKTNKCEVKLQKGIKNLNQGIQNKIPTKELDQKNTIVEYDEQVGKKCIKYKPPHSLKPYENHKTKCIQNPDYCKSKFNKDKEKSQIENESNTDNEFSYLIPHATEEITNYELYNLQIEESVLTAKNVIEASGLPVSVMTASERVSRNTNRLEEPSDMHSSSVYAHDFNKDKCISPRKGRERKMQIDNTIEGKSSTNNYCKIRTRSTSIDELQMATASPDLFDTASEDMNISLSRNSYSEVEINEVSNTVQEEIPTTRDCLALESKSLPETDNVNNIKNYLSRTPEKVSSASCRLSNLECSPILGSRPLNITTKNNLNNYLQHGSKRMKIKRKKCNIQNEDTKKDTTALITFVRKDFKGIDQIQESENDNKEEISNIEEEIFEFSNSSKNCIRNRKTLEEIMKTNDREDRKKSNYEEILETNSIEIGVPNHLHMKIPHYNLTVDDDDESNDDDLDLPDLGSAQDYEVSENTAERLDDDSGTASKHVLIKEKENTNNNIVPVTDNLSSLSTRCKRSEYYENDECIPTKDGKESDVPYSTASKSLLCDNEIQNSNKNVESVSNGEETNSSNIECTLEENSISSCFTESAESPDTRRSQRIKSIKENPKRRSCCFLSGCETMDQNFRCKKSTKINAKSKTNSDQNIEYSYMKSYVHKNVANKDGDLIKTTDSITQGMNKSSCNIGDTGGNKKNNKKRDENLKSTNKLTLIHSSETISEENFKESCEDNNENNNVSSISADELFNMSCEQKNTSLNLGSTGTESNVLQKFDDTQALFDMLELECDISKEVQPMPKTKKAMAEFDKMYKNFKSKRKKQNNTDITMFMDSCQVTKKAKQIKSIRKKPIVNRKFKTTNLPNNQQKLNCWLTKSNTNSNPSLHVEEPKASGSKDFENILCENDLIYKQSLSKGKNMVEKRKQSTNNSRFMKKCRLSEFSSDQNYEVHAPDEGKDVQENESKGNQDHSESGPLRNKDNELDENLCYSTVPTVDDNIASTSGTSEQLESSIQITHEEKCLTQAEKASLIARDLEVINIEQLETLVIKHLPYLKKVAKGDEENERHIIYMQGGAAARSNTPEVIFAPFTDEQLEHVHAVLRTHLLKKLLKNIEGKEYLWMVLVPTFLIKLVMEQENVSYEDAELLFKHMAFPKRANRDSLGLGDPW